MATRRKPNKHQNESTANERDSDEHQAEAESFQYTFERDLSWCIGQLQKGLENVGRSKKDSDRAREAAKLIKSLQSSSVPMVKKRLLMRQTFGDYHSKIAQEEKEQSSRAKRLKMTRVEDNAKKQPGRFIRSAVIKVQKPPSSEVIFNQPIEFATGNSANFLFTVPQKTNSGEDNLTPRDVTIGEQLSGLTMQDRNFQFQFNIPNDDLGAVTGNVDALTLFDGTQSENVPAESKDVLVQELKKCASIKQQKDTNMGFSFGFQIPKDDLEETG